MALIVNVKGKNDDTYAVRFRREPKHNGGGIIGVIPTDAGAVSVDRRLTILEEAGGFMHEEVDADYLRSCPPASPSDRDRAGAMLRALGYEVA